MQLRGITIAHPRRVGALVAVVALFAAMVAPAGAASSQAAQTGQTVSVTLSQRDLALDPADSFQIRVRTQVTEPTEYLETRLQIHNPSGSLLFQKTEIRHDVEPGSVDILFERELEDLSLPEGRYPIEARILATGSDATYVEDRLLVIRDDRLPLDVAAVARFRCTPARDPEDRFVIDPGEMVSERDALLAVARIARAGRPLSLAVPPVLLEDWLRASEEYELLSGAPGEGTEPSTVHADDVVPVGYSTALERLGELTSRAGLELLDVPFAEPDLRGLQTMSALDDLAAHYHLGRSVYQSSISTTPSVASAIAGDAISAEAAAVLSDVGIGSVLVSDTSVRSEGTTPTTGAYRMAGGEGPALLVVDSEASRALQGGNTAELVERLFELAISGEASSAVAQAWFGRGESLDVADFEAALAAVSTLDWVRLTRPTQLARAADDAPFLTVADGADQGRPAPLGYWGEVLEARRMAVALVSATGERDADARRASRDLLIAESCCWAGTDGAWELADRGRAFASAAVQRGQEVFSAISVSSENITLAGRSGKVPLSIGNSSEKELSVVVTARGEHARIGPPDAVEVTLKPADNFVTLPVDMRSALVDRLEVQVLAGGTVVASTSVEVRASYLDRLAWVGSIVLVLAGLLFYIRRRVMT